MAPQLLLLLLLCCCLPSRSSGMLRRLLLHAIDTDGQKHGPPALTAPRLPNPPGPRAAQLLADLGRAVQARQPVFTIAAGDYYFNGADLLVAGAQHLTLAVDAAGATLWFHVGAGVRLDGCLNVTILGAGLRVDYDPPPFMQATALADATLITGGLPATGEMKHEQREQQRHGPLDGVLTFTVPLVTDPGFSDPISFWDMYSRDPATEFVQGPQWWAGDNGTGFPMFFSAFREFNATTQMTRLDNGTILYRGRTGSGGWPQRLPRAGDKVTVVIRKGYTWLLHNCSGVVTRDIRIHTASFMAVTEFNGHGGNVYHNVQVVRRTVTGPEERCGLNGRRLCLATVAANADVFHSSGCQRGPVVQGCEFSYALDDFCNVHSRVQVGLGVIGAAKARAGRRPATTRVLVADPRLARDAGIVDDLPYGTVETMPNVRPGMTLAFRDLQSLALLHRMTVIAVERLPASSPLVSQAQATLDRLSHSPGVMPALQPLSVSGAGIMTGSRVWLVDVETGGEAAPNGTCLVEVEQWANSGSIFRDNLLHSSIDGLRWKSSDGQIINNTWRMAPPVTTTALELTPLRSYLEGPLAISGVLVEGNVFSGVPPERAATFVSQCLGMGRAASPPFRTCTNNTVANNRFLP